MAALCSAVAPLTVAGCSSIPHESFSIPSTADFCRSAEFLPSFKRLAISHTHGVEMRHGKAILDGVRASSSLGSSSSGLAETEDQLNTLEGIKVYDPNGAVVLLVSLWESRPAVVAFARHFGCILCRKRADLLQSRKAEIDAVGAALVLIAPGSPEQARQFVEQTNFSGEVYADPNHASYDALQFVNGVLSTFNPRSGSRIAKALTEGYRQDWELSFYKDTMQRGGSQQGGILVAGPGVNTVRYLFKDAEAGDEPELEDVISACCST